MGLLDTVLSSFKSKSVEDLPQVSAYSFGDVLYPYETHYFDIDELHIAYVEKGEGMPILFLHGQGSSINVFTPVLAGFHDHYRVLALDFPGFGKSGKKKICTNRREYNKLLSAFINEVVGESCWIVGHSLGGLISILVAEENPQLILGMTLVDSGGFYDYSRTAEMIFRKYFTMKALVNTAPEKAIKVYRDSTTFFPSPEMEEYLATRKKLLENKSVEYLDYARAMMGNLDIVFEERFTGRNLEYPFPVQIIWGDKDKMIPVSAAHTAREVIPKAALSILEDCGHFPILEYPQEFIELVNTFMTERKTID